MGIELEKVTIKEAFGIDDLGKTLDDFRKAALGKGKLPRTQFDITSVKIFKPQIAIPTWLGITRKDRLVPIYNFYNRNTPPPMEPFSVKVTFARDFTGGKWTYDGHPGTDFATPVGTHITTAAPGIVMRVTNNMDHGGLKIFIDHGEGLVTTYGHLSRALVSEGDRVGRGQSIALSGAAGMELVTFFPWVAPHLHLNVVLNSATVDPFALDKTGEASMWMNHNDPRPYDGPGDTEFTPTKWDEKLLDRAIEACIAEEEKSNLRAGDSIEVIASNIIDYRMFYRGLFHSLPPIYEKEYERKPMLDLPFRAKDYDGVKFPGAKP